MSHSQSARETVFSGRVIETRVDTLLMPDGKQITREVVQHPGAVAIVPIDTEENVLLVRQYRYAAGQSLLELPAGVIEDGESPDDTAQRELQEEKATPSEQPPSSWRRLLVTRVLHGVPVPVPCERPRSKPTAGRRRRRHSVEPVPMSRVDRPDQARRNPRCQDRCRAADGQISVQVNQ